MNDLASDFGLRKQSDLGEANTMDFGGDASLQSAPSNILTCLNQDVQTVFINVRIFSVDR